MRLSSSKNTQHNQRRRILIFISIIAVVFTTLILRLWYLQVIQCELYQDLSKNNRIRLVRVKSPRGIIYDNNGIALATNRPFFSASVTLEDVKQDLDKTIGYLSQLLNINAAAAKSKVTENHQPFQSVDVKQDLKFKEVAQLEEYKNDLSGVIVRV